MPTLKRGLPITALKRSVVEPTLQSGTRRKEQVPTLSAHVDKLFLDFQVALAGRYSLERELGRGGMGVVYLAREVRLDRLVAIKLLPPDLAVHAALKERFMREARLAARLSHPHIVPIHAVDELERFVFYVMAYVRGETLAQRVAHRGALTAGEAARVLREVAWALAHAHAAGVVHRDVKPENILLEDGSGRAMVTDFGIARQVQISGPTAAGEALGTPDFMSPEQATGEEVDARSDVYSLGVVGFYVLTGRLPFEGPTAASRMAQHVTRPAPALPSVVPGLPKQIGAVVNRCLVKDRAGRYEHGGALADAISLALERRRELPGALRMYLAEADTVSVHRLFPMFLLGGLAIWVVLELTLSPVLAPVPPALAAFLTLVRLTVLTSAFVGPLLLMMQRLRRVALAGHDHDELLRALAGDTERLREDFIVIHGRPPRKHQGWWHGFWMGATAICGAFVTTGLLQLEWPLVEVTGAVVAATSAISLFGAGAAWRASVFGGFRQRFWASRLGRLLFRAASLGRPRGHAHADANRPTEMAVGLAAAALFETLPKETQRALHELPAVVRKLQADAQSMRRRSDDLTEALASADGNAGGSLLDGRRAAVVADLRAAQADAQRRLGNAVAALETIRLDLLRLRGGVGTVASITADLDAARELGVEAERLLVAHQEVEKLLSHERAGR